MSLEHAKSKQSNPTFTNYHFDCGADQKKKRNKKVDRMRTSTSMRPTQLFCVVLVRVIGNSLIVRIALHTKNNISDLLRLFGLFTRLKASVPLPTTRHNPRHCECQRNKIPVAGEAMHISRPGLWATSLMCFPATSASHINNEA